MESGGSVAAALRSAPCKLIVLDAAVRAQVVAKLRHSIWVWGDGVGVCFACRVLATESYAI